MVEVAHERAPVRQSGQAVGVRLVPCASRSSRPFSAISSAARSTPSAKRRGAEPDRDRLDRLQAGVAEQRDGDGREDAGDPRLAAAAVRGARGGHALPCRCGGTEHRERPQRVEDRAGGVAADRALVVEDRVGDRGRNEARGRAAARRGSQSPVVQRHRDDHEAEQQQVERADRRASRRPSPRSPRSPPGLPGRSARRRAAASVRPPIRPSIESRQSRGARGPGRRSRRTARVAAEVDGVERARVGRIDSSLSSHSVQIRSPADHSSMPVADRRPRAALAAVT